jgi:amidase
LRTTHGLVDRSGLVPLAPSFDTVGWLTRSPKVLEQVTRTLLPTLHSERYWSRLLTLPEAEALTDDETRMALAALCDRVGLETVPLGLTEAFGGLDGLRKTYATLQAWEAWKTHGSWITAHKPVFGPAIAQRFEIASRVTEAEADQARQTMVRFRADLRAALREDSVLILPAAAGPAPRIGEAESVIEDVRIRTLRLTCLAGLGALPQVTMPFRGADKLPRGLGLVGPAGSDRALVEWALRLCRGA